MQESSVATDARSRLAAAGILLDRLLHDLKQPLNLIRVIAQDVRLDLKKGRFEIDSLPENMGDIENSVDELVTKIDHLRFFAQPKTEEETTSIADVNEVCRAALKRLKNDVASIDVKDNLAPDLPTLAVDPFILEQALWELLDNAVRSTTEAARDRPYIEISTSVRNDEIVVAVQDNGCGVPEDVKTRIFEPFFSTREKAAGLGLALALAGATSAGGRIELASSNGQGSLFELIFSGQT